MKKVKILIRTLALALSLFSVSVFGGIIYADNTLSKNYYLVEGTQFKVNCQVPITVDFESADRVQKNLTESSGKDYKANFKLLGVFPVRAANVNIIDEMAVKVLGTPFGVKAYTDGVLVVGIGTVDSENGEVNPAEKAGIKMGDTIISVDGKKVYSNDDVYNIVSNSDGQALSVVIKREKNLKTVKIQPVFSKSAGIYRIGVWVRDSTAGIGTLTFYSPAADTVCGLGHGICDADTEKLMEVSKGEIVKAEIISVVKGAVGAPGELKGRLKNNQIARLNLNAETGVYGECVCDYDKTGLVTLALKQDIENGPAYIYTTVEGETPQKYACEIEIRKGHTETSTHNMVVTITDERLINKTGGIVQGMSGSPILQNGKLIGAVTHVFINDSKKGYAIFAENMLETAQSVAEENLKEAS